MIHSQITTVLNKGGRAVSLALVVFFRLLQPASAQIMIEQGKVIHKVSPGETVVNTLNVHNTSKTETLRLKAYWNDFMYVEPYDGTKEFTPAGTSEYSCGSWISFSPQEFTMEPLSSKKISYSVQSPATARGGYYGVLFLEEGGGKTQGYVAVNIVTRVGSLFFIETDNRKKAARIENLRPAGPASVQGEYANEGDVISIPDGIYYILDSGGLVADRGTVKKFYLPPAKKVSFDVPFSSELKPGQYTMVLTFDLGDGDSVVKEMDFSKSRDATIKILKTRD